MPMYQYVCKECQHTFDELMGMHEPPPPCPKCRSRFTLKCIGTPGVLWFCWGASHASSGGKKWPYKLTAPGGKVPESWETFEKAEEERFAIEKAAVSGQ